MHLPLGVPGCYSHVAIVQPDTIRGLHYYNKLPASAELLLQYATCMYAIRRLALIDRTM
jgi:hypothetical protein